MCYTHEAKTFLGPIKGILCAYPHICEKSSPFHWLFPASLFVLTALYYIAPAVD